MNFLKLAKSIEREIINDYKELHKIAEVGFDLPRTVEYVESRLSIMSIDHEKLGGGIVGYIGDRRDGCTLLRADMDALPIKEKTNLPFSAAGDAMHACGHDAHTAMLLGAARLLRSMEQPPSVKLMLQPAEEILLGAKSMITSGVLNAPEVGRAFMLHVIVGTSLKSGSLIVSSGGVSAPEVSFFRIRVRGSSCHGSTPEKGRDAIRTLCGIITAIDCLRARELPQGDGSMVSVGKIIGGESANVISDNATAEGSLRAFSEETADWLRTRIRGIVDGVCSAFLTDGEVEFYSGAPGLLNDSELSKLAYRRLKTKIQGVTVTTSERFAREIKGNGKGGGSEDFAYVSKRVPSVMIGLAAGSVDEGYLYPLHHHSMKIDPSSLAYGAAALSELAVL